MFKVDCTYDLTKLNQNYPKRYIDLINRVVNKMAILFNDELLSVIIGGPSGKGDIIDGYTEVDLYVVLNRYDVKNISKLSKYILLEDIDVVVTYYLIDEVLNDMLDSKTKVLIYEKDKYKVNPTLYGNNLFNIVSYKDIKENDKRVLPTVLHDVRCRYTNLYSNKDLCVDRNFIYQLTVLLKCILNYNDIFVYGYNEVFSKFKLLFELKLGKVEDISNFDIIDTIHNLNDSKANVLAFCKALFEYTEGNLIYINLNN